jgi:hypothetical protein
MFTQEQRDRIAATVRTLRIVVGAMLMGVLVFLGVVLAIRRGAGPAEPFIAYLAAAFALVCAFASTVVPNFMANQAIRLQNLEPALEGTGRIDVGFDNQILSQLLAIYQTRLIVACALLEGAAFFNLVAYMIEGWTPNLVVTGVLLVMMAMRFPTTGGVEEWVSRVCGRRQ